MADVLKSLIVFAVVLALIGTAFAGIYYFTVDVPGVTNSTGIDKRRPA